MLRKILDRKWYFILAGCILGISFIVFHQYIFGGYYFFSQGRLSDLLRANLPVYYQMYDGLLGEGFFWSWKMGIGTSMFTHADVYFDPFTYIVFLLGRSNIPKMMIWLFVVKIMFQGWSFSLYLNYFKLDKRANLIAAILYAFSGYSLIMGSNFALGTVLVYLPLVLLGIEKSINEKKNKLLLTSLFLMCIYSYYYFYITGILAAGILSVRLLDQKKNPIPKLITLVAVGASAIFLSLFTLLPQLQLVLSSARVSGSSDITFGMDLFIPEIKVLLTSILRAFNNDIIGNGVTSPYMGQRNDYFECAWFVSAAYIVLLFQFLYNEKRKRKTIVVALISILVLTIFPIFSYIFNGFATINYRWMFIVSMLIALMCGFAIDSIIKHKGLSYTALWQGILCTYAFILISLLSLSIGEIDATEALMSYLKTSSKYIMVITAILAAFCFLYMLQKVKTNSKICRGMVTVVIAGVMVLDISVNYYHWYGSKEAICDYGVETCSYEDESYGIIQKIQKADADFYRINKSFDSVMTEGEIPSENDALVQNYYGLRSYNSLNNANYISFLQNVGVYVCLPQQTDYFKEQNIEPAEVTGNSLNYIDGVGERYNLMNYLGVRYYLTKNKAEKPADSFIRIEQLENIDVYENRASYPLAFVNKQVISYKDFVNLTDEQKEIALLKYTVLDEVDKNDEVIDLNLNTDEIQQLANEKQTHFQLKNFSQNKITFQIVVQEESPYMSFSIPYDEDWHVYVDGKEVKTSKINIALLGAKVEKGSHEVVLIYRPKLFYYGLYIALTSVVCIIIFHKKLNLLLINCEKRIEKSCLKMRYSVRKKINDQRKGLKLIILYGIISILFAFITLYFIYPDAFYKEKILASYSDWSKLDASGYEFYDIKGNEFTAKSDNPCLFFRNIEGACNKIEINITEILETSKGAKGELAIQTYWSETETFSPEDGVSSTIVNNNLKYELKKKFDKNSNYRIDIGEFEGDKFELGEIKFINRYKGWSLGGSLLLGIITLAFFILFYGYIQKKVNISDSERDSNLEVCRLICMLLIIAHHCVLHGGAINMKPGTNLFITLLLIPGGKLCFDTFLAITCWFLVDQKFRTERFLKVWFEVFFYSVLFAIVAEIFGMGPSNWFSILLPITGNSHGFAASYLAFYLLVPFLGRMTKNISKRQARWLLIILFYIEVGAQIVGFINQYYQPVYSELLLFVLFYVLALNLKRWPIKMQNNKKVLLAIISGIWFGLWVVRCFLVTNPESTVWNFILEMGENESSILNIVGGFALFLLFKNIKMPKIPVINLLATGTLGILLIHDHNFFRYVLWSKIIKTSEWYYNKNFIILVVASVLIIFLVCTLIDFARREFLEKRIFKFQKIKKICIKCDNILDDEYK